MEGREGKISFDADRLIAYNADKHYSYAGGHLFLMQMNTCIYASAEKLWTWR